MSLKELEEGEVILRAGITNQEVPFVKITDNGPGIALDIMDEIFIPFFTTKNKGTDAPGLMTDHKIRIQIILTGIFLCLSFCNRSIFI